MGYLLRVGLVSFFTGAATSSFVGLYILHKDYKVAQESIAQQMKGLHESLDQRISSLEKFKQTEVSQHAEATE
ncbi:ABC transporter A family protein [Quillaja saponaria]|uniref:ABC transporter A family protein n=1 Tax=Quillaja saponaria TaxID=32244 RepID=A0AAD7LVS6_QUISA|nr:ABC transporter A family protein [Quillaja saponaria]KAJ7965271.1 ABC transporter A family protein [Quillaja saponaria]